MLGRDFIEGIRRKLGEKNRGAVTDRALAEHLGLSVPALNNWSNRRTITIRQMVGLLFRLESKAGERAEKQAIRPIVEFFKLSPNDSRGGARREIFRVQQGDGGNHPYLQGLRRELEQQRGVYILHDSRGRALYVGKTKKQTLWSEINSAYNRNRSVQQIRRVNHPERRQDFRKTEEKRRQIRLRTVPLHELGAYFSAYQVTDGLIGELESLLIRSFANDLLNTRMENFMWEGAPPRKKRRKRRQKRVSRSG
jgi:hypothetical protein